MASNPFKYAGPLGDGDIFVDREAELQKIVELVSRSQPVAIYGERRIGKTSLLNKIRTRLGGERVAYISFEEIRDDDEFLKWLAGVVNCADWSTPIDLIPALEEHKPILLLDEFDKTAFSEQFDSDFFHLLRAWASQGLVRLVIASLRRPVELLSQSDNITSPFYNIFYGFEVTSLDPDSAGDLLSRLDTMARGWQSDWKARVIANIGLKPWELQHFGYRAWEALAGDSATPLADLLKPQGAGNEAPTVMTKSIQFPGPTPPGGSPGANRPAKPQWWKTLPVAVIAAILAVASFLAVGGALSGVAWLMGLAAVLFFVVIVLILAR